MVNLTQIIDQLRADSNPVLTDGASGLREAFLRHASVARHFDSTQTEQITNPSPCYLITAFNEPQETYPDTLFDADHHAKLRFLHLDNSDLRENWHVSSARSKHGQDLAPAALIQQRTGHTLSNPPLPPYAANTKQIDPTLLELEASLQAHEDHLAHQFMDRVEAIERTRELDRYGFIPLGHALRMITHFDVEDLPTANQTYDRWTNKGTFIEGKMYANFDLDTITVTAYFAEVMPPHQSSWEDFTVAQIGVYPNLNEDCVILAEDVAQADFETSALRSGHNYGDELFDADWSSQFPNARDYWFVPQISCKTSLIQKLVSLETTLSHLVKCGGCHLLFPQAQILHKLCEECRVLTPDVLQPFALRPQTSHQEPSLVACQDCSEPAEFGVMCSPCEDALLSTFEPQS